MALQGTRLLKHCAADITRGRAVVGFSYVRIELEIVRKVSMTVWTFAPVVSTQSHRLKLRCAWLRCGLRFGGWLHV